MNYRSCLAQHDECSYTSNGQTKWIVSSSPHWSWAASGTASWFQSLTASTERSFDPKKRRLLQSCIRGTKIHSSMSLGSRNHQETQSVWQAGTWHLGTCNWGNWDEAQLTRQRAKWNQWQDQIWNMATAIRSWQNVASISVAESAAIFNCKNCVDTLPSWPKHKPNLGNHAQQGAR